MSEIQIQSGAISPGACISGGWDLIKPNYGLFILITFLLIIIVLGSSFIPYAGSILQLLISVPLMCGVYMTLSKSKRDEPISVSNLFEGFSRFVPSFLLSLIPLIPSLIFGLGVGMFAGLSTPKSGDIRAFSGIFIALAIFVWLFIFSIQILLFFSMPLIAERNVSIGEAIRLSVKGATQNLGGIIILVTIEGLMLLAGILALCVGILFVLPIIFGANFAAYKSVFPDAPEDSRFNAPPNPDAYGGFYGNYN